MTNPGWMNDGHVHLVRDASGATDTDRFLAELDSAGVTRAAVVTPSTMAWDNSVTVQAIREHPDRFVGIGRVDPSSADAAARCADLLADGIVGIRLTTHGVANLSWLDGDPVHQLAEVLGDGGGVVEFHSGPAEFDLVAAFAQRHPGVTVLLDHGGRPDVTAGLDGTDHRAALALARFPNVATKTPGAYFFSRAEPPHRDLAPYQRSLLDAFGAERVMWGSDWPGCLAAGAYVDALAAAEAALEGATEAERDLVLGGTFDRVLGGRR